MWLLRLAETPAALPIPDAGPDRAWLSAPAVAAPPFPEAAEQAGESRTREGRAEEEVRGPAAAGGGGEQAAPGRGGAPRCSVADSEVTRRQAPPLTARPSSPRLTHRHRLRPAVRPPPPSAPARPRLRRALTPPGPAAAQRAQQAPLQAPPPAPRRPHPGSTRHASAVGPGLLRS